MRHAVAATLLGLSLASPAAAQVPNVQQLLGGLLTGNQSQDQAVRDAFERGYQRGREDEARRQQAAGRGRRDRGDSDRGDSDRGDSGDRGRAPPYSQPGNGYYGR
jgi:hypothetical protein